VARYSRQQDRWIRNRFAKRGVPLHQLDTGDVANWDSVVRDPAYTSVEGLLSGTADVVPGAAPALRSPFLFVRRRFLSYKVWLASRCASPPPPPSLHPSHPTFPASAVSCDADAVLAWRKYPCEACGRELNGDQEWAIHIKSRKHWKNVARVERLVALAAVGGDPRLLPHTKRARSPKSRGEAGAGPGGAPEVPKGE
jgi:hypothetical protein